MDRWVDALPVLKTLVPVSLNVTSINGVAARPVAAHNTCRRTTTVNAQSF